MAVGGKYQRKGWARLAMTLDVKTGMLMQPELGNANASDADLVGAVVLKAIQLVRAVPSEVRVQTTRF